MSIPPVLPTNRPSCCHPSFPMKDAAFSSTSVNKSLSACKMRSECATIVNLRSDRIIAEDVVVNVLTANQVIQVPPPMGNFIGTVDGMPFASGTTWSPIDAANLSWSADGIANLITSSGNTITVMRDGFYGISLNLGYTTTTGTTTTFGWIVNGADPSFPIFSQSTAGTYVENGTTNIFLTTGTTLQVGVMSVAADFVTINSAYASIAYMGTV